MVALLYSSVRYGLLQVKETRCVLTADMPDSWLQQKMVDMVISCHRTVLSLISCRELFDGAASLASCSINISSISCLYSPGPQRLCRAAAEKKTVLPQITVFPLHVCFNEICLPFLHALSSFFSMNKYLGGSGRNGSTKTWTTDKHAGTQRTMFHMSSPPRISLMKQNHGVCDTRWVSPFIRITGSTYLRPKNCPESFPSDKKVAEVRVTVPLICLGEISPRYIRWRLFPRAAAPHKDVGKMADRPQTAESILSSRWLRGGCGLPAEKPNSVLATMIISKDWAFWLVSITPAPTMEIRLLQIIALLLMREHKVRICSVHVQNVWWFIMTVKAITF